MGALLVHTNDVVAPNKAIALLQKENLQPIKDFNPLDPVHLVDPSYKDSPLEERTQRMCEIFDQQIQKTLQVLRPPVKFAVARDFVKQKFISASDHEDLVNLHGTRSSRPSTTHIELSLQVMALTWMASLPSHLLNLTIQALSLFFSINLMILTWPTPLMIL